MEDASVVSYDESSSEDTKQSMNGKSIGLTEDLYTKSLLLDVVNGSDLPPPSFVEKAAASDQLKLEENLESEDLINNNKGVSEPLSFINQRTVTSGDATAINDQLSFADNLQQPSFMPSEDMEYKETLNLVHDSAHCPDRKREQAGGELYNGKTKRVLENHAINRVSGDIEGNGVISQDVKDDEEINLETTVRPEQHDPSKGDLLSLKQNPEDQKEFYRAEFSLYEKPEEKDFPRLKNSKYETIYFSETLAELNSELIVSNKAQVPNVGAPTRPQDLSEDIRNNIYSDCNDTVNTANNFDAKKYGKHLQNSKRNVKTGTNETESSVGHLDLSVNSATCEAEKDTRSLDFQPKHTGLPKPDGTRASKKKMEHQLRKGGRSGPHYEIDTDTHELEFAEKDNLSEKDESSEEDNIDNSLHYGSSRDRLDHRKERHQYVSDKLDPDVLHLLEMHLRKQQLVDIKEEGEEELLDVHINKEKSRSESFKLLRNIPPVLDMVLEEPELERAVELLEEGSKTPSDIDSDDSSNICAMEMCLMESLQHDLLSKSSKIDKHEIATIFQTSSSEVLSVDDKSKQKPHHNSNIKCGSIKNKEADTYRAQMGDPSGSQVITAFSAMDGVFGSDFGSECAAVGNVHDTGNRTESSISDTERWSTDQSVLLGETVDFVSVGTPGQSHECLSVGSVDSDLYEKRLLDVVTDSTHTGTTLDGSKEDASIGSDSTFLESVKTENHSGLLCPTSDGDLKFHDNIALYLETKITPLVDGCQKANSHCPSDGGDFATGNYSTEQQDAVDKALGSEEIRLTDLAKDLQANVKSAYETNVSERSAEMSTLYLNLEEKILSILEKAHAADCRSSRLQAEAELLWKESIELRNECKSLSKEAAELLSIFNQQAAVPRHPARPGSHQTKTGGSILSDTKPRNKETLSCSSKTNSRNKKKGEDQLQLLSKKYNFLRQEAPEIMQELRVLQLDLKNLPPHHSKPISVLYHLLWGSLITGGTMLFVWWMNKQLG